MNRKDTIDKILHLWKNGYTIEEIYGELPNVTNAQVFAVTNRLANLDTIEKNWDKLEQGMMSEDIYRVLNFDKY